MNEQGDLFLPSPDSFNNSEKAYEVNKKWAQLTQAERQKVFEVYHERHPEVYAGIVKLSNVMRDRGMKHWGVQAAFEVLRFEWALRFAHNEFKVNNNFASYYSRFIMAREVNLNGFYETRKQGSGGRRYAYRA